MNHTTLICGSIAFDKIMQYEGRFGETLLADQLHKLSVSFLVPTLRTEYGGCAINVAYNLRLLGGDPLVMGTIGQDGSDYLKRLEGQGISTRAIRTIPSAYTAQCFVTADLDNNQINAFHPGAMQFNTECHVADVGAVGIAIVAPDGREGMLQHARDCAAQGIPLMFDPGQQLPMFNGAELLSFIEQASYVACNDYEMEMLMDRTGLTLPDVASRLKALIVTRGEKGSEIYADGQRHDIPCVPAAAVVDPTGCGDAYRAGLLYGITHGFDWPTTGRLASLLGSIKIAHLGAQNHTATPSELADKFEAAFGYRY